LTVDILYNQSNGVYVFVISRSLGSVCVKSKNTYKNTSEDVF